MTYMFRERSITRLADLLVYLSEDYEALLANWPDSQRRQAPVVWYRGLPSNSFSLLPTLHRENLSVDDERYLINRFKQNAHEFLTERP